MMKSIGVTFLHGTTKDRFSMSRRVSAALTPTGICSSLLRHCLDLGHLHHKGPDGKPALYVHGKGDEPDWIDAHVLQFIKDYLTVGSRRDVACCGDRVRGAQRVV
ncbi:hypothetical protein [Nocardia sp. NRRL S-836]|uniref:hypothetical protein n=1 Tax=Nocardia sp. NRRL S-836 TaxID=1519492 RepID=UPI0006B019E6|nr:hypothetical protein [Nocardia sp. NRRL S-836]KOV84741.1 hypothetical protein ADL03_15870 [Nocardia sp. NRRL S-836]